jgi:hypothetical protein
LTLLLLSSILFCAASVAMQLPGGAHSGSTPLAVIVEGGYMLHAESGGVAVPWTACERVGIAAAGHPNAIND